MDSKTTPKTTAQHSSSHTPGPWKIHDDPYDHLGRFAIYPEITRQKPFADPIAVYVSYPNARLIAAAPEMVAFIKAIVSTLDWHQTNEGDFVDDMRDAKADARALLAKIEGNPEGKS